MKTPVEFPFEIRIPAWCKEPSVKVNGKKVQVENGAQIIAINRKWSNLDQIVVHFPMEVTTSNWGRNSVAVERGPLVYALKIKERWEKGNAASEGNYFSVFPESEWNFGLTQDAVKNPEEKMRVN